jgi:hypothetical protein
MAIHLLVRTRLPPVSRRDSSRPGADTRHGIPGHDRGDLPSGLRESVRHVDGKTKARACRAYGIRHHQSGAYEIDHLISLELGGSNDIRNLWPESFDTQPWNAHAKDRLENRLHGWCATE